MADHLDRFECIRYLADMLTDELVVAWTSFTNEWTGVREDLSTTFAHNGMGCTVPVSLGLATALPDRTVVGFAGDGDLLMQLGALPSVGREDPDNLIIFVKDNESYMIVDDYPTMTAGATDLAAIAEAAGVGYATTVRDFEAFRRETDAALNAEDGARLIVMKTAGDPLHSLSNAIDERAYKYQFVRSIEASEGVEIFPSPLQDEIYLDDS